LPNAAPKSASDGAWIGGSLDLSVPGRGSTSELFAILIEDESISIDWRDVEGKERKHLQLQYLSVITNEIL
jgi:hypothetical protein